MKETHRETGGTWKGTGPLTFLCEVKILVNNYSAAIVAPGQYGFAM